MVTISVVQGRLSSPVGGRYQHSPIHGWRDEFQAAADLGLDGIEWIVSDFSNPLFDPKGLDDVRRLIDSTGVGVTSISLDVLMYHPVRDLPWLDVAWLFDGVGDAVECLETRRISIPVEEISAIRSADEADRTIDVIARIQSEFGRRLPRLSIETDLSPRNAQAFLEVAKLDGLGLLVDIGNAAANGFAIDDYFSLLGPKIYGFHVKDRSRLFQPSCPLGSGDGEIQEAIRRRDELPNLEDIVLQAHRSFDDHADDVKSALAYLRNLMGG